MDKILYNAALEGHLVLTVNDRLARDLLKQYDLSQQRLGLKAWLRPDILSLSAWLSRCQTQLSGLPLFLSKTQLQYLWEKVVSADVERTGNQLLQIPQTAKKAMQAHQLLSRYSATFTSSESAEDHRAFLRWRKLWQKQSSEQGWADPVELPWLLANSIKDGLFSPPKHILLAGFDDITPDLKHLFSSMENSGALVNYWHPEPCVDVNRQKVTASDSADEVKQCALWIRALLTKDPSARIAVVAPQLEAYQSLVEQTFIAEFDPESVLEGIETTQVFNLSLGHSLEREGVVHAALSLLRLGLQIEHEELSWLLRTPYIGNATEEGDSRARIDREMRRLRRFDWPMGRLSRTINGLTDKFSTPLPGFIKIIDALSEELQKSKKQMPGVWSESFANFLHKLGWPGDRGLSSREYQAVQHFRSALGELASLDSLSSPLSRADAVKMLQRISNSLEFQPEGSAAPVQVLGVLESSGLKFDHLWVLGLHDSSLPMPPSPNPFIPLPVQRRYQMKRSDSERELLFAEQVVSRLFSAAPEVVLSCPLRDKGAEQRPSFFIHDISEATLELAETSAPAATIWSNRPELETLTDVQGPSISSRKPFTGGTGIIKDQALCPFRAFAHHRLRAVQLDEPDIGIDNMSRGTLVHTVLELFWEKANDQKTLLSLDEKTFADYLEQSVDGALNRLEKEHRYDLPVRQRRIERRRLISLARTWLDVESRRSPFRVVSSEKSHQVKVGNLMIRTRIDRVDELEDGTSAIIDYKTGRPDPLQWLDERVTEPQLPAYCLDLPKDKIGAVMFAMVRSKEKEGGFRGLSRDVEGWPGAKSRTLSARLEEKGWSSFDDVLDHWQTILPDLGDAFANGIATVDPVDPDLSCKYCDLTGLCRILEREADND